MKRSCTDTFFVFYFNHSFEFRTIKERKKDKRTTGDKSTKTQDDAMEVIMIRDHKITN